MDVKNITEIILESLLTEGRVEDVKKRYPKPTWRSIDELVEIDPSGNNKYLDWMAKNYLPHTIKWFKDNAGGGGYYSWTLDQVPDVSEDSRWDDVWGISRRIDYISNDSLLKIKDDIEHFHKNPSKYEIKDINKFSSKDEFHDAVEIAKQKLSRKEMKETGVDKVYEDDSFILLMPKTHKASCRYGSNTRWCVTMRDRSSYFENYFTQGPIFFLIDKRRPPRSYTPRYMQEAPDYWKVAIHYKPFMGRLYGNEDTIKKALSMGKEEFLNKANLSNSVIDYWNVIDAKTPESKVAKFLAGPGKGQSKRSEEILNTLKGVMEKYTKNIMSDYYDSLADSSDILEKYRELEEKKEKISDKNNQLLYKSQRLNYVINQLSYFKDGLSDEDTEYLNWYDEQDVKANEFKTQIDAEREKVLEQLYEISDEIDKIRSKIEGKSLVFYDKERHTPIR